MSDRSNPLGHPGSILVSPKGSKEVSLSVEIRHMVLKGVSDLFRERMAKAQKRGQAEIDHLKEVWETRRDTPWPAGQEHPHNEKVEAANAAVRAEAESVAHDIKEAERRLMEALIEPLVDLWVARAATGHLSNAASRYRPVV